MSTRPRLSVWTSASQAAHNSFHRPLSVDDLLDHTWHYECVVSPSYSALLKLTELKARSSSFSPSHSSTKPAKPSSLSSPSSSSTKPAKPSSPSSSSSSTEPAKSPPSPSSSSSSSIKPAKSSSSSSSSSSPSSSSTKPASSSTKPASNLPKLATQSSTEYVSLASFINISNNSYSSSSGRSSTSPGFDYLRKHSKPTNALSKCRDRERKSTREDPSRISFYAGFLAVD